MEYLHFLVSQNDINKLILGLKFISSIPKLKLFKLQFDSIFFHNSGAKKNKKTKLYFKQSIQGIKRKFF